MHFGHELANVQDLDVTYLRRLLTINRPPRDGRLSCCSRHTNSESQRHNSVTHSRDNDASWLVHSHAAEKVLKFVCRNLPEKSRTSRCWKFPNKVLNSDVSCRCLDWPSEMHIFDWAVVDQTVEPRAGSGVVRIYPLHFLAGCRKRRLNQALSVLSLSLGFFWCVCCVIN